MRLGLLNLTTTDILDQAILQMFSSIPGIYPLDASNTPTHTLVVTIKYNSRHCQMSPGGGGAKSPQLRATELDLESEMPTIISCYTNERRSISSPFPVFARARLLERPQPSMVPWAWLGLRAAHRVVSPLAPCKLFESREFITTTTTFPQTTCTQVLRGKKRIKLDECYCCIAACKTHIMLESWC